jgi:hypothetical protein
MMLGVMTLACVFHGLTACSRGAEPMQTAHSALTTSGASTIPVSVCDRHILKPQNMSGILGAPVTGTRPVPGDAQSCEFITAGFPAITVSLRPGVGRATVEAWASGSMPLASTPLTGIGDGAVWQDELHELIAQRNELLCDIQVSAGSSDLAISSSALPSALGELCNRIFAAY